MEAASADIGTLCREASVASRLLASAPAGKRDQALTAIALGLRERTGEVLEANRADLDDERARELTPALRDRLSLDEERVEAMAVGAEQVRALDDPLGEVLEEKTLPNGLRLEKVRVPLGVVAVVYEARPNVTIDCSALTIKSGNALVLRGSSYAERTNSALADVVRDALAASGLPEDAVVLASGGGREALAELATREDEVDLLIPRGGEGLKQALKEVATVPVIYAASGNCHVYVHEEADLGMARAIAVNAKVNRPGVCNAAETLLVDRAIAPEFLPLVLNELAGEGVELVGDAETVELSDGTEVGAASEEDWDTEFLDLKLAVGVVDDLDAAIEHVNAHGSGHSEAIVTQSEEAAGRFAREVDAAAVYVNASTRFTDGFEYGLGAEIGNSTQKLHARGPIGLRELTTYKYVVRGEGQIRG